MVSPTDICPLSLWLSFFLTCCVWGRGTKVPGWLKDAWNCLKGFSKEQPPWATAQTSLRPLLTLWAGKSTGQAQKWFCPGISPRVMRDGFRGIPGWIFSSTPLYLVVLSGILIWKSVQNLMHCWASRFQQLGHHWTTTVTCFRDCKRRSQTARRQNFTSPFSKTPEFYFWHRWREVQGKP